MQEIEINEMKNIKWFHSIKLSENIITPGLANYEKSVKLSEIVFSKGVNNKSLLDIGTWDGFFSFEAEKNGAQVLSTDHYCWNEGPGWGTKAGFDFCHKILKSKIKSQSIDVPSLSPKTVGRFDVVLLLGVLYHLRDPYTVLEQIYDIAREYVVIETVITEVNSEKPIMEFFKSGDGKGNDNYFAVNIKYLEKALKHVGFKELNFTINNPYPNRCTVHAFK